MSSTYSRPHRKHRYASSLLLSEGYEATIEAFIKHRDFLHALGAKVIGASEQGNSIQGKDVSIFGEKPVYTDEQWALIAKGFNEMGRLAKEKGMYFTVHHHMGTGVQTEAEIDKLMEITDPDLVYLLFDTGHLSFSGEDVIGVLKKYVNRVKHVHLKSIRKAVIEDAQYDVEAVGVNLPVAGKEYRIVSAGPFFANQGIQKVLTDYSDTTVTDQVWWNTADKADDDQVFIFEPMENEDDKWYFTVKNKGTNKYIGTPIIAEGEKAGKQDLPPRSSAL